MAANSWLGAPLAQHPAANVLRWSHSSTTQLTENSESQHLQELVITQDTSVEMTRADYKFL
jgi:hypothetical protein